MCTAITYQTKDFYFGRTLDNDFTFGEQVTITPRNYGFHFRYMGEVGRHFAMIGIARIEEEYPLYYEGVNEKGLGMAGLNFVGNAHYGRQAPDKDNVASFELIPWILGQCASVQEARALLARLNLVDTAFRPNLPPAQLHWMIADNREAITVEVVEAGLKIYENPAGVLTNNPSFPEQMFGLNQYMALTTMEPVNNFSQLLPLHCFSRGMGAMGLPGDLSSTSRFARVAFVKMNSVCGTTENESVSQFFHILGSVSQQRGCCQIEPGKYEVTAYTCCCNADQGILYYTTYENHQITAVDMHREDLEGTGLVAYPMVQGERIWWQN